MSPDRNHIHHKLIDIGLSHNFAVITILITQSVLLLFNIYLIDERVFFLDDPEIVEIPK